MSITAASATFQISIPPIFIPPQTVQGYSADAAWTTEAVQSAELVLGVDAKLSAGWVPTLKVMTVTLMPDQGGDFVFDEWFAYQDAIQDLVPAFGTLAIPALGRRYTMLTGYLSNYMPMVGAARTLQPRPFQITWQTITSAPL